MHLDLYKITHKKFDRWEYYFLCVITIFNTENITTNMSTTLNNTMELLIQSQMENFVEKLSDDTKRTRPIDLILGMHAKSSANEHRGKRISCIEQKICTKCDTSVNTSILHELELKEFNISGLCESCQNHFFRSDKQEPTTQNSSISMSISSPVMTVVRKCEGRVWRDGVAHARCPCYAQDEPFFTYLDNQTPEEAIYFCKTHGKAQEKIVKKPVVGRFYTSQKSEVHGVIGQSWSCLPVIKLKDGTDYIAPENLRFNIADCPEIAEDFVPWMKGAKSIEDKLYLKNQKKLFKKAYKLHLQKCHGDGLGVVEEEGGGAEVVDFAIGDVRMDETKEPHTEDVPIPSDELLNDSVGFMEFLNQNVYDEQPMDEHHVIMLGEAEQAMVFAEEALLLARENYAKAKKIKKSTDRMVVKAHMKSLIDSEKITQEQLEWCCNNGMKVAAKHYRRSHPESDLDIVSMTTLSENGQGKHTTFFESE